MNELDFKFLAIFFERINTFDSLTNPSALRLGRPLREVGVGREMLYFVPIDAVGTIVFLMLQKIASTATIASFSFSTACSDF